MLPRLGLLFFALVSAVLAAPITQPGPAIIRGTNDAAWLPLFTALAQQGAVRAQFEELRWLKVRKQPLRLAGEMRLDPARGLSLHYGDRTVIVDARGMLLRDARGRSRAVPQDARAATVSTWLLPVLRFDLPELEKSFRLHGASEGDGWRLDFLPREEADPGVSTIVVHGTGPALERIELRPKPDLRVEIAVQAAESGAVFSAEEVRRFFR